MHAAVGHACLGRLHNTMSWLSILQAYRHTLCNHFKHSACLLCSAGERLEYFARSHLNLENNIKRTPCGMNFLTEWGSCRHAAGCAAMLACYARTLRKKDAARAADILDFARKQARFIAQCNLSTACMQLNMTVEIYETASTCLYISSLELHSRK
jgi:hypothetical protein